jgi:hypothetical protein
MWLRCAKLVFAVILGTLLAEGNVRQRLVAASIMVLGVMALALG